ncbi:MAG: hypothetical protein ACTHK4_10600 [Mycobacteriales bacterium]
MFRRAAKPVAGVVLVAALVFAGTLSGIEWHRADVSQSRAHARQDVAARAGDVATALFTYDYRNLAATQQRLSAAATGGFAQLEAAQSAAVQQQLRKAKAIGSATVKEVNVSDVSGSHATAFVVLATHVTSTQGSSDGVAYVHLDLRIVGSVWKVDDVQNLSAPR